MAHDTALELIALPEHKATSGVDLTPFAHPTPATSSSSTASPPREVKPSLQEKPLGRNFFEFPITSKSWLSAALVRYRTHVRGRFLLQLLHGILVVLGSVIFTIWIASYVAKHALLTGDIASQLGGLVGQMGWLGVVVGSLLSVAIISTAFVTFIGWAFDRCQTHSFKDLITTKTRFSQIGIHTARSTPYAETAREFETGLADSSHVSPYDSGLLYFKTTGIKMDEECQRLFRGFQPTAGVASGLSEPGFSKHTLTLDTLMERLGHDFLRKNLEPSNAMAVFSLSDAYTLRDWPRATFIYPREPGQPRSVRIDSGANQGAVTSSPEFRETLLHMYGADGPPIKMIDAWISLAHKRLADSNDGNESSQYGFIQYEYRWNEHRRVIQLFHHLKWTYPKLNYPPLRDFIGSLRSPYFESALSTLHSALGRQSTNSSRHQNTWTHPSWIRRSNTRALWTLFGGLLILLVTALWLNSLARIVPVLASFLGGFLVARGAFLYQYNRAMADPKLKALGKKPLPPFIFRISILIGIVNASLIAVFPSLVTLILTGAYAALAFGYVAFGWVKEWMKKREQTEKLTQSMQTLNSMQQPLERGLLYSPAAPQLLREDVSSPALSEAEERALKRCKETVIEALNAEATDGTSYCFGSFFKADNSASILAHQCNGATSLANLRDILRGHLATRGEEESKHTPAATPTSSERLEALVKKLVDEEVQPALDDLLLNLADSARNRSASV